MKAEKDGDGSNGDKKTDPSDSKTGASTSGATASKKDA
jgi:hypothetical protein